MRIYLSRIFHCQCLCPSVSLVLLEHVLWDRCGPVVLILICISLFVC